MSFSFHPELLGARATFLQVLNENDLDLFSNFTSVDPDHEDCGLDVEGVKDKSDAIKIHRLFKETFPLWKHRSIIQTDSGWKVYCSKDAPRAYNRGF